MVMSKKMKSIRNIVSGFVAIILLCFSQDVNASHIVGADMSFTCKGEEWFMINLTVRRDCNNGDPEAVFDDPAYVGIFDAFGTPLNWLGSLGAVKMELVSVEDIGATDPGCTPGGQEVCVSEARYVGKAYLPFREKGYILAYQRCCRNQTLNNILDPTQTGNTSFVCITEESMTACNNSPSFQEWPDLYICAGEQLVFSSAGVDIDGDDLRYTLYTPLAGATLDMPQPIPPAGPPYDEVIYAPGFSMDNQLGSGVPLAIDYNTGVITATPELVGQFLVGVLIEEWRDGVMLSKTRRNFEYNVRDCSGLTGLSFNTPDIVCEGLTVTVDNNSNSSGGYKWNFNYPSDDPAFMSTEDNPSFTYPAEGDYQIQLTSTSGEALCNTEVIRQVRVINSQLSVSFDNATPVCTNDLITLDLTSTATEGDSQYSITDSRYEIIIDGLVYPFAGGTTTAVVPCATSITIVHYVTSSSGCTITETKVYNNIGDGAVSLNFLAGPITVCPNQSTRLVANPNPAWTYTWTPTTGLTFPNGASDPVANPDVTTTYSVTVSNGESTVTEEVTVFVQNEFLDVSIVNNSGTCGGEVNLTGVASNGGPEGLIYEWSFDPNFATVAARGQTVNIPVNGNSVIYMRAGGGAFCGSNVPSISLGDLGASNISASFSPINTCIGNTGTVSVVNSDPNETFTVVWEPTESIISGLTGETVTIDAADGQTEVPLTYTATTSGGCVKTETINVPVVNDIVVDISSSATGDCTTGNTYQALSNTPLDMTNFEWSLDPDFSTILSTDPTITVDVPAGSTLYLRATTSNDECKSNIATREIMLGMESLEFDAPSRICLGDTADIDLITPDGEVLTVTWSPAPEIISGVNDTKVIVVGMNTGNDNLTLSYTATNQAGCSFSGTIDIPYSTIIPTNLDPQVQCGTNSMAFSIDPIYGDGDVLWDFGVVNGEALTSTQANPTIDFGMAGTYSGTLTSTMETCNFDAESVTFEVPEILEIATEDDLDQSTCDGGDPNLTLGATSVSDIVWTDQDGNVLSMTDSVTVDRSEMTSITATVSDTFGCEMTLVYDVSKYDFDVTITGPGTVEGGEPACGESVDLNVTDNTGANVSYMWTSAMGGVISGGDTANPTIDPSNAGDLVLTVTNEDLGCSMEFPVPIDGSGGITASINATPGTTITSGESVTLDVVTDATGATYEWADDGSTNGSRVVMPTETTTYTVTVTDENGCTAEAMITITVEEQLCSNYMVPEAFTPNGDGNNDVLMVRSDGDLDEVDFQILDRWGKEVFRTMRQDVGWNGFHQNDGAEMAPDVFAYCLKVVCNGQEEVIAGSVSLIR